MREGAWSVLYPQGVRRQVDIRKHAWMRDFTDDLCNAAGSEMAGRIVPIGGRGRDRFLARISMALARRTVAVDGGGGDFLQLSARNSAELKPPPSWMRSN